MTTIIIVAAVIVLIILLIPSKKKTSKKKGGNGTDVWNNTPSMRIAQFADSIRRKIKDWIGG